MKDKILKAASTLPFWVPYPFIFLAIDYYLSDEQSWIAIALAAFLGILCFGYAAAGKEKEMFFGCDAGVLISVIIICIVEDGFDKSFFYPFASLPSYFSF